MSGTRSQTTAQAQIHGHAAGRSTSADVLLAGLSRSGGATAAELAEQTGVGRSTASKVLAALAGEGLVTRAVGGRDGQRRLPDRWSLRVVADGDAGTGGTDRLGKGGLQQLILHYLKNRPGDEFSSTAIARALGRSTGATGNALIRLAADGSVTQTNIAPRRYAWRRNK